MKYPKMVSGFYALPADEKAFKRLQILLLHQNVFYCSTGRTCMAPCNQRLQLLLRTGCKYENSTICFVFHTTGNPEFPGFFTGALPVINALHFSTYHNRNCLQHVSELNIADDLLKVLLIGGVKLIVFTAVSIKHSHHFIIFYNRDYNFRF